MATLSDWHNYDYNGVIFVFGRVNSTLTSSWANVTKVTMSVDSASNFVYSANIKNIPYTQKTNWDGSVCANNESCKVFNINTFTHRTSDSTKYQFSSGTHTCYLRFWYSDSSYVQAAVSVIVHATLTTPTVTVDEENGIINVSRTATSGSPRYYIDIRRKDRSKVNSSLSWSDKDYIHTVIMKGVEGGKYNEGIPHTGLMTRGTATISGSSFRVNDEDIEVAAVEEMSANNGIMLLSTDSTTPTTVTCDTDIPYTSSERYNYYVFTAPAAATYQFTQTDGPDLRCRLYSDSGYSNRLASHDDRGNGDMSFDLLYALTKGQTVYIEIYDYSRNGQSVNLRINTVATQTVTSFTPYTIAPYSAVTLSYYSSSNGYMTLYPAKKATGLRVDNSSSYGSKSPYYVLTVVASTTNTYLVSNSSAETITFWLTNLHSDIDYQPYWRVNPISQFKACVIFDNAEIEAEYSDWCIAQVEDALTRLSSIISETSGNSIAFNIVNEGVSKLYVSETIEASSQTSRYVNSNKITSNSSKTLYYASVSKDSIYRVSYSHDTLYYAKAISTNTSVTTVTANSAYLWYEDIGGDYGADENTLVVQNTASGYYVLSNSPFTLEKVMGTSDSSQLYHDEYGYTYNITVRFGLDGTTWMGDQGIATSGGTSAYINGQGQWMNWLYYNSEYGVQWSYAIINVDNSDLFETLSHVIHEEIAQSLGIGDDCYSHEESIHWDPEQANPDWYDGIDRTILDFAYNSDKNGYTQFDLCNEFDLPITLFREYSEYNSTAGKFQFRIKDAGGNWLLRSGDYEVRAWCVGQGVNNGAVGGSGSSSDGWDDDPYSLWTAPVSFTVTGGWYWSDYGVDMENGSKTLKVADVHHTIWNAFVDAVAEVMGTGTIPNNSTNYGSAANLGFSEGIKFAYLTEDSPTLYAQRFNIVNYIINSKVTTNIGVKTSLTSQVLAEDMITLQDCRNQM